MSETAGILPVANYWTPVQHGNAKSPPKRNISWIHNIVSCSLYLERISADLEVYYAVYLESFTYSHTPSHTFTHRSSLTLQMGSHQTQQALLLDSTCNSCKAGCQILANIEIANLMAVHSIPADIPIAMKIHPMTIHSRQRALHVPNLYFRHF